MVLQVMPHLNKNYNITIALKYDINDSCHDGKNYSDSFLFILLPVGCVCMLGFYYT